MSCYVAYLTVLNPHPKFQNIFHWIPHFPAPQNKSVFAPTAVIPQGF
jgi:hypothetical protein